MNIITNKSGKIIHLGSMMLLPGESGELPKAYENNPIVSFLEDRGAVEVARKNAESDEKVTPSEVPTEKPSPAEIPAGEPSNAEAKRGAAKNKGGIVMELLTLLRTIAPEFEELEDTVLQTWLDLTQPLVSKSAFGAAYEQAVAYLAAHRMKMAGLGESGAFGSAIDRAGVTSYTEGSTSVSFGSNASSAVAADSSLTQTPYGLEYLRLRQAIIPIMVRRESNG